MLINSGYAVWNNSFKQVLEKKKKSLCKTITRLEKRLIIQWIKMQFMIHLSTHSMYIYIHI